MSILQYIFFVAAFLTTVLFLSIKLFKAEKKFFKKNKKNPYFFLAAAILFSAGAIYELVTGRVKHLQF